MRRLKKLKPARTRLFQLWKLRIFWLDKYPVRQETGDVPWIELGRHVEPIPGFIKTGAIYLGIGKLSIIWLTGLPRPSNVLEFKRGRVTKRLFAKLHKKTKIDTSRS